MSCISAQKGRSHWGSLSTDLAFTQLETSWLSVTNSQTVPNCCEGQGLACKCTASELAACCGSVLGCKGAEAWAGPSTTVLGRRPASGAGTHNPHADATAHEKARSWRLHCAASVVADFQSTP
eukprot:6520667-Alexandrium_andersonii.AAC.1